MKEKYYLQDAEYISGKFATEILNPKHMLVKLWSFHLQTKKKYKSTQ